MANVLLTTACNLRCAYCFAQERMRDSGNQIMSVRDAATVIAFLKKSGHPIFRVMGGEPTLHPHFQEIVEMAFQEGLSVDVLSNATWPEAHNRFFQRVSPRLLCFLLNIDHPTNYAPPVWDRIQRNLAAVAASQNVTLSFNIFELQPKYEYILDLVRTHRIDKIRMSFSLPVVGAHNTYLSLEECKCMGPFVVDFARRAADLGAEVHLDNAVPLCIFTYEQAGELLLKGVLDLKRNAHCEPIVDIGPDLRVWCCFCLSKLWNRRLDEFDNLDQIIASYSEIMRRYQGKLYPLDECGTCRYREQLGCQGGCLSYSVQKHGDVLEQQQTAGAPDNGWCPEALLALHTDVEVQHYDIPEPLAAISRRDLDIQMTLGSSFAPLPALLDGTRSGQQVLDELLKINRRPEVQGPVAAFAEREMREGARNLLLGMLHEGFVTTTRSARPPAR